MTIFYLPKDDMTTDEQEDRAMYSAAAQECCNLVPTGYDVDSRVILQSAPIRTGLMKVFCIYYVLFTWGVEEGGTLELHRWVSGQDEVLSTVDDNGKTLQLAGKMISGITL